MNHDLQIVIKRLEQLKDWAQKDGRFVEESVLSQQIDTLKKLLS